MPYQGKAMHAKPILDIFRPLIHALFTALRYNVDVPN